MIALVTLPACVQICRAELRFRTRLSPECTDLIRQCLSVQSDQRPTLEALLAHPWLQAQPPATPSKQQLQQPSGSAAAHQMAAAAAAAPPTAAACKHQRPQALAAPVLQQHNPAAIQQQHSYQVCPRIPEDQAAATAAAAGGLPIPRKLCTGSNGHHSSGLNSAGSSYCSSVSSTLSSTNSNFSSPTGGSNSSCGSSNQQLQCGARHKLLLQQQQAAAAGLPPLPSCSNSRQQLISATSTNNNNHQPAVGGKSKALSSSEPMDSSCGHGSPPMPVSMTTATTTTLTSTTGSVPTLPLQSRLAGHHPYPHLQQQQIHNSPAAAAELNTITCTLSSVAGPPILSTKPSMVSAAASGAAALIPNGTHPTMPAATVSGGCYGTI